MPRRKQVFRGSIRRPRPAERLGAQTYRDANVLEEILSDPQTPPEVTELLIGVVLEAAMLTKVHVHHPRIVREAYLEMVRAMPEYDPENPDSPTRDAVRNVAQLLWQVAAFDHGTGRTRGVMAGLELYERQRQAAGLPPAFIRDAEPPAVRGDSSVVDLNLWRQVHPRRIKQCIVEV